MNPSQVNCKHHIKLSKPCPWCDRQGFKEFTVNRPWQLWQIEFQNIVQVLSNRKTQGPCAYLIGLEDLNGEVVTTYHGPLDRLIELHKQIGERIEELKGAE